MSDHIPSVSEAREKLRELVGRDCYRETVLFPGGKEDVEAMMWLVETLLTMIARERPNAEKARRCYNLVNRLMHHGYVDHVLMHAGKRAIADDAKLRATIDHLTTKLEEKL